MIKRLILALLFALAALPAWAAHTVTQANMKLSLVNGTAFVDFGASGTLTPYLGDELTVCDSSSHCAVGYISAAGTGETYGSNLLSNPGFTSCSGTSCSGWSSTSSTITFSPPYGVFTATPASNFLYEVGVSGTTVGALYRSAVTVSSYSSGLITLYMFSFYSSASLSANGTSYFYHTHASSDGNTNYDISTGATTTLDVGSPSLEKVLTPSSTGVTIVSTPGGSTYNWASINSSFNYNDSNGYTYSFGYAASPSESNVASDTISRLAGFGRSDSESNTASDSISRLAGFGRSDSETNTASDSIVRAGAFSRSDAETQSASDFLARVAALERADSEVNAASDLISRLAGFGRSDTETNPASDAIARAGGFSRHDAETQSPSDSIARAGVFSRRDTETQSTADSLGRTFAAIRAETESLATADNLSRAFAGWRAAAEALAPGDSIFYTWTHPAIVLGRHAFILPGQAKSGAVPGQVKTGESPPAVKSGAAPVH